MAELDDRGRDAADGLLAKVTAVARAEAARAVAEKLNNVVEGGRLNWEMLTQWGHHLLDNGVAVPIRPNLDLVGFTVADVPAGDLTRVTGGGGGGGGSVISCQVYRTTDKNINNGAFTAVDFDAERQDTSSMHDNATNNSRVVLPEDGTYLCVANVLWYNSGAANPVFDAFLQVNGTFQLGQATYARPNDGTLKGISISKVYTGVAGDYIELYVQQLSGAIQPIKCGSGEPDRGTELSVTKLG
jgi:hypothetical protein